MGQDRLNILIIDGQILVRQGLRQLLCEERWVQQVDVAATGDIALKKIERHDYHVIVLDPFQLDEKGVGLINQIRALRPQSHLIVFSQETAVGSVEAISSLSAGANDYVSKPDCLRPSEDTQAFYRKKIFEPIQKAFFSSAFYVSDSQHQDYSSNLKIQKPPFRAMTADILIIGSSTGGPQALEQLLSSLPKYLSVPVLIVQHIMPDFSSMLVTKLNRVSNIPVHEYKKGEVIKAGQAYLAIGGVHMMVRRGPLGVILDESDAPPENSCRPAIDVLLRSAVSCYEANVLAVILTGMGQDGLMGCKQVFENGGRIVVQDKKSSLVWGMPGHVAEAGLADEVVSLDLMTEAIQKYIK